MLFTQLFESDFNDKNDKKRLAETHDDYEDCSYCSGTGEGRYEGQSCSHCGGSGVEPSSDDDDVDITDDDWYDDSEEPESYYEKSLRSRGLNEFAPGSGDDGEPNEEILRKLAAQWWSGTEQQMARSQQALEAMGWEIGPDESGDDDAGVYVYRIGDDDGRDTIAFGHSELSLDEGVAEGSETYKQGHAKFHTKTNKQIGPTHYGKGSDKKADSYTKADPRYHEVRPVKEQGVAEGVSKQFEIIYYKSNGDRMRTVISGTSKSSVAKQFKKQHNLEIEQVKELKQGVAEAGFTKTPSGDYINQHTGVRSSTAPKQKPVRGYKWEVNFDYGPHQTTSVKVTASSENEACAKAEKLAEKNGYRSIMINWAKPAEQGVAEVSSNTLKSYQQKVSNDSMKHKMDPTKRSPEKANRSVGGFAKAQNRLEKGVAETRVGNRMGDMEVGNPKIVHKNGKAVGEIGIDHDPSPGNGPYYMKHYETNTWYSGYPTKKEALADLKHVVQQMNEQGVAEANKKKDDLEPQVRDVALQRAISRAKADFPTAGSGIEALSKDFMRSQEQDQKSFDQIRQAERQQDQMLDQIAQLDQSQTQEIQSLEKQNSGLASRLQQLQAVNDNLEKKLAAMSGRKTKTKTAAEPEPVAKTPTSVSVSAPKLQPGAEPTATAPKIVKKSQPSDNLDPGAYAFAQMTPHLGAQQKSLPLDDTGDNILPATKARQQDPRFAAAQAGAEDLPIKYSKIAKQAAGSDPAELARTMGLGENDKEKIAGRYDPDEFDAMVARVGQKAREQEKKKPVDIKDLARRLAAVKLPDEK